METSTTPLAEIDETEAFALGSLLAAPSFGLWMEAQAFPEAEQRATELEAASGAAIVFTPVQLPGAARDAASEIEIYTIASLNELLAARIPRGLVWVCGRGQGARVLPLALQARRDAVEAAKAAELQTELPCRTCGASEAEEWFEEDLCGACFDAASEGAAPSATPPEVASPSDSA